MKQTPLYDHHKKLGAKMVEFGGWQMPVSYSGILKEHEAVRTKMGLFDVSHMGEVSVEGPDALAYLQWLTCNDLSLIKDGQCQYNLLMNPEGGVVDDIIIHRLADQNYFICVNASNTDKDYEWFLKQKKDFNIKIQNKSQDYAQIALQGPMAESFLRNFVSAELSGLSSFHFLETFLDGRKILLARTGYTGEDGFEIYCASGDAGLLWDFLLERGGPLGLVPCGLGCRDTLRLEMAYPLYGHELRDDIGPFQANLAWVVKLGKGDFMGRPVLLRQKEEGVEHKRVGFVMKDEGIARAEYPVFSKEEKIGWVMSGTYSPSLDKSIGCGYVRSSFSKVGTIFEIEIRGKKKLAEVVTTPFYKKKTKD